MPICEVVLMIMDAAGLLLDDMITTVYERKYVNCVKDNFIIIHSNSLLYLSHNCALAMFKS